MAGPGPPPPRIFGIPATRAPVVAVLRRGPSDWWHVGRWDLERLQFEPGSWFKGSLYPQKCDLSPDGRWLAYSALGGPADWPAGSIYEAISRLPWLTALAAWGVGTTYTRGFHFDDRSGTSELGPPDVGDASPCLQRYGLALNRPEQFAVERRRGWTETPSTAPRDAGDWWDERREVEMEKARPDAPGTRLVVEGSYAGFRSSPDWHDPAVYSLHHADDIEILDDVQWADWDQTGRLLVATTAGHLELRVPGDGGHRVAHREDLSRLRPDPQPPPQWAHEW